MYFTFQTEGPLIIYFILFGEPPQASQCKLFSMWMCVTFLDMLLRSYYRNSTSLINRSRFFFFFGAMLKIPKDNQWVKCYGLVIFLFITYIWIDKSFA